MNFCSMSTWKMHPPWQSGAETFQPELSSWVYYTYEPEGTYQSSPEWWINCGKPPPKITHCLTGSHHLLSLHLTQDGWCHTVALISLFQSGKLMNYCLCGWSRWWRYRLRTIWCGFQGGFSWAQLFPVQRGPGSRHNPQCQQGWRICTLKGQRE